MANDQGSDPGPPSSLFYAAGCLVIAGFYFLGWVGVTWLLVWVFSLFDVALPYWKTFWALFVIAIVLGYVGFRR